MAESNNTIRLKQRLWKDRVELVTALMHIFEFGEDNDGQIVLYTNCRDNGSLRGDEIEEFPDDPYIPAGELRSAN